LKIPIGDDKALAKAMSRVIDEAGLLDHLRTGALATDIPTLDSEIEAIVQLYETLLFSRRMAESRPSVGKKKGGKALLPRGQAWNREGDRYLRDIDRLIQSILENSNKLPIACYATLFVNKGAGFNAQDMVRERVARSENGSFQVSFDLSGFGEILGARFDPWEGFWGRLRLDEIVADRGSERCLRLPLARVQPVNGNLGLDGFCTFNTCDPIMEIPNLSGRFTALTIKGSIEPFNAYRMEGEWANEKASFAAEKDAVAGERAALAAERNTLAKEKDSLAAENIALAEEKAFLASERNSIAFERISLQDQLKALVTRYEERLSRKDQELHGVQQLLTAAKIIRALHAESSRSSPVVLFGAGTLAEWVLQLLDRDRFPVRFCFDNRPRTESFHGIEIQKPSFIPGVLVIVASMYDVEIRKQLRELGFKDGDILSLRQAESSGA
jgi:hypothetical protein